MHIYFIAYREKEELKCQMDQSSIKHFAFIDKALLHWVNLYLEAEEIADVIRKKNKLLHQFIQLQEIAFGLPKVIVDYDLDTRNYVFQILTEALHNHFSP